MPGKATRSVSGSDTIRQENRLGQFSFTSRKANGNLAFCRLLTTPSRHFLIAHADKQSDKQGLGRDGRHEPWCIMPPTTPFATIDYPAYWLVALDRAVAQGKYHEAAVAQDQLRRLGIDVTLRRVPPARQEVDRDQ